MEHKIKCEDCQMLEGQTCTATKSYVPEIDYEWRHCPSAVRIGKTIKPQLDWGALARGEIDEKGNKISKEDRELKKIATETPAQTLERKGNWENKQLKKKSGWPKGKKRGPRKKKVEPRKDDNLIKPAQTKEPSEAVA